MVFHLPESSREVKRRSNLMKSGDVDALKPNRIRRRPHSRPQYFYLTASFCSLYSDQELAVIPFGRTADSS